MRMNGKKVIAVGVSCLVASGLIFGSVEYASHTFAAEQTATGAVKTSATKSTTKSTTKKEADSKVEKQETVYVTLGASGERKETIVSDWLKNSGINGTLEDVSELKDIQNTKGSEKFTQNNSKLSWETKDKDIYYQGTSDAELPVGMEISYCLDGKKIAPKDLPGKSGKLEISIQYQNRSVNTVTVNGEEKEIYTPFVMATGMILPVEKFSNVTVDNGQILSEGDNDVVVAYGMPGLKESLDLDNIDFGEDVSYDTKKITDKITDSVKITADVKDFEMGATYTMATASLFDELDFDDISDGDDLDEKMDELKDAAVELVDGSEQIQDGLQELEDNFAKYEKAIRTLEKSVKKIDRGSKQIQAATKKYTTSTDTLLGAVNTYVDGAKTFAKSTKTYSSGTKKLVEGVGTLCSATSSFPKSYTEFHTSLDAYTSGVNALVSEENMNALTDATASLKKGVKDVDDGLKSVQSGVQEINTNAKALNDQKENADQCITGLRAMKEQYSALAASEGDATLKAQYQKMADAAEGAIVYMQSAEKLAAGIDAATNGESDGTADGEGSKDLAAGLSALEAATDTDATEENLYTGISKLNQSAKTMSEKAELLRGKKSALMTASTKISSSISEINKNLKLIYKNGTVLTGNNSKLQKSADALSTNATKVKKNSKKLTASSGDFRKATRTMASGTGKLYKGVKTLTGKTGDVSEGIHQLADGAQDLYDGMQEFREDGVEKLTDTMTSLLDGGKELKNTASEICDASEDYKAFSGISEGMDGQVKFIMTTEEIKDEAE